MLRLDLEEGVYSSLSFFGIGTKKDVKDMSRYGYTIGYEGSPLTLEQAGC